MKLLRSPLIRISRLLAGSLFMLMCIPTHSKDDETPPEYDLTAQEDWYRVEVLIFSREDEGALTAEFWDPLPALTYPDDYRFLLDPPLADQRFSQNDVQVSAFSARGIQTLTLQRPPEGVDPLPRPDAILVPAEPEIDPLDDELPTLTPDENTDLAIVPDTELEATDEMELAIDDSEIIDPDAPILALPFVLLDNDTLEFRGQARRLQRQGRRILFHGSWWLPLPDGKDAATVVLDRAADYDSGDWPALQGSISLYRTRYLHADLNLWLNTAGDYLPAEWSIPAPPLAERSVRAERHDGSEQELPTQPLTLDDLLPAVLAPPGSNSDLPTPIQVDVLPLAENADETLSGAIETPDPYFYRHAIVHRQSRRMRSGELHYLDHPVLAVVLRLTPVNEDNMPLVGADRTEWRERHGLPAERPPSVDYEEGAVLE
jgi:hypothetical protein